MDQVALVKMGSNISNINLLWKWASMCVPTDPGPSILCTVLDINQDPLLCVVPPHAAVMRTLPWLKRVPASPAAGSCVQQVTASSALPTPPPLLLLLLSLPPPPPLLDG